MTRFFIHHPVFAWVLAIVVMLGGVFALNSLSISQYPSIAPTTVRIQATYTGASAKTIENSVTKQIESQMTGLDGLLYMTSQSSQGAASISLVFDTSLSPELAQVEVQNKLSNVEAKLPSAVQQAGLRVSHSSNSILLIAALVSTDAKYDSVALGEILSTQLEEPIERTSGVGDVNVFSQPYAMRIWLDPTKLYKYQLTPASVVDAVSVQNTNVSAGYIGDQPVVQGQEIEVPLTAQSMLTSVDDFKRIVLKTNADGSSVYVGDVARVELGAQSADVGSRYNGHPAAGIAVNLAAGANAVDTSLAVRATIAGLTSSLPPGVEVAYPYDTAPFVQNSINDVYKTLFIAIVLVFLVILVFLQSWRATIIPTIAVPIVLLGTFGVLDVMGMSINTLTMFALVLAIGLLVDDAIVVVENVERVMDEENVSAFEATEKSMSELSSALIGIVLVLSAVFLPMAFMSGSTGVIYRQFSVTIISAMVLSLFVALILTPTMCARLLKPGTSHPRFALARWFNKGFDGTQRGYVATVRRLVRRPLRVAMVIFVIAGGVFLVYGKVPNSFLPTEDQGVLMVMVELPEGSTKQATTRVVEDIENYLVKDNAQYVTSAFASLGFSFSGSGQNEAMIFAKLKDYSERKDMSAGMIAAAGNRRYGSGQLGQVIFAQPPSIPGLGTSSGFTMELVDQSGTGTEALAAAAKDLSNQVKNSPDITGLRGADAATTPSLKIIIDPEKAQAYGISLSDINSQLSTIFAGNYVNDFIMGTKLHEVIVEGDAPYRMQPQDIGRWFTKNSTDEMVPYDAFTSLKWQLEPKLVREYGSTEAIELQGDAAPGVSSGQAMDTIQKLAEALPGHYGVAWTGLSYQQVMSGNQEPLLYSLSGLVVFLCLAALYESWTVPFSVMLAVPVGVLGALLAAWLFGQANDVYFKVGMLTTIGLSARNAILIVEFAQTLRKSGLSLAEATITASRLRLRPILMTSFAFALGILPLAVASGAGSASQNSIGIGMLGGVLFTALFGTFLCPAFYVAVMVIVDRFHRSPVELAK